MKNRVLKYLFALLFIANSLNALDVAGIVATDENQDIKKVEEINTKVFGSHLFNGSFKDNTTHIYNPDYTIVIGDQIALKVWGAIEFEQVLTVDSQGNVFIPRVGAVNLLGAKNGDLVKILQASIQKVYRNNVFVYADMNNYQNVSVFVTGNVNKPGLYQGLSSDSIIQYIDKASGINTEYGSFRDIKILRNNQIIKTIDLYDFLQNGKMDLFSFRSGDVVLVENLKDYVFVEGDAQKPFRFELGNDLKTVFDLSKFAGIKATTTNAALTSYTMNNKVSMITLPASKFSKTELKNGDIVSFIQDHNAVNMKIFIQGEHNSLQTYVVKKGTSLKDAIALISPNAQTNLQAIQLYRKSVAVMQKKLIEASLRELETLTLTNSAVTKEEASMRASESKFILEFIERVKKEEPKGQVVIDENTNFADLTLEDGDIVNIPAKSDVILVQGEVGLPGAFTYNKDYHIDDYIKSAGYLNERANKERILVIKANGKAERFDASMFSFSSAPKIDSGDAILVLPKVEGKTLQITGALTQILYHVAVATKVVLDI